jgi:hypothetical protein
MFISSGLFQFRSDDTAVLHTPSFYMDDDSSQKSQRHSSVLGKRSRTDEHNDTAYVYTLSILSSLPLIANRPRKTRTALTIKFSGQDSPHSFVQSLPTPPFDRDAFTFAQGTGSACSRQTVLRSSTSPPSNIRRRIAPSKRSRARTEPAGAAPITYTPNIAIRLTPCHICHKAPRMKKDLEAYADCLTCQERTCYICIRRCEAGSSCDKTVCKQCCVEEGIDGIVHCFECLEKTRDHEMQG